MKSIVALLCTQIFLTGICFAAANKSNITPYTPFEVTGIKGARPCPHAYQDLNCDPAVGYPFTKQENANAKASEVCHASNNTATRVSDWIVVSPDSVRASFICIPPKNAGDIISVNGSGGSWTKNLCDGSDSIDEAKNGGIWSATWGCGYPGDARHIRQVTNWIIKTDPPHFDESAGWFCYSVASAKFECQ